MSRTTIGESRVVDKDQSGHWTLRWITIGLLPLTLLLSVLAVIVATVME